MRLLLGLALLASMSLSFACSDPDIGKACDKAEDCSGDLICDVHDGKGTCQEPHGHEAGEEEGSAGTTAGTTG